jgi:alpha-beta hydrolase superfamily lysophospholipase
MSSSIQKFRTDRGDEFFCRLWSGAHQEKALVYLHGIESHAEWFADCAEKIESMGVSVYAPDRRGSGLNGQSRGDCTRFLGLVDDVVELARIIESSHRELHIAGLSWGCKLAVAIDMHYPGLFSSMTLISPGIFSRVMPGLGQRLHIAFDAMFRPTMLHTIPIEDEMFTSDSERLKYIATDPLRLRRVTARFYFQNVLLERFLKNRKYQWSAPTQMLLAENDAIVDNRRTTETFESLEIEKKMLRTYAGCRHSLQFEEPEDVAQDIVSWISDS